MIVPTVGGIARVLYRRKWTILFVAAIVGGLGAFQLINAVPTYQSSASLVVRFGKSALPVTNLARESTPLVAEQGERHELLQEHSDILLSRDVAREVIEKLGLDRLYPGLVVKPPLKGTPMEAGIVKFDEALFASSELSGTVIHLAFSHPDPKVARAVVEALIEVYMQRESQIFSGSSYEFQKSQVEQANQQLTTVQDDLSKFKAASGVSDFDYQMNARIQEQSDLAVRLQKGRVALAEATERRDSLTRLLATVPATIVNSSGASYNQVDTAQSRLNALKAQERELIATHGPDWPALTALRASLAEAAATASSMATGVAGRRETQTSEVYNNIKLDLVRATADAESAQQAVLLMVQQAGNVDAQVHKLETIHVGLAERDRQVALADSAYRAIALHLEDSRIGADRLRDGLSRVAVISQPSLPYQIAKPRYLMLGLAYAAAAILAGVTAGLLREFADDRLVTAEQIAGRLNVPVLATLDKA